MSSSVHFPVDNQPKGNASIDKNESTFFADASK